MLVASTLNAAPATPPQTIQLTIGGGSVDSAAFRWSSALAETLSRPPGLPDCDPAGPCGVPGVVAGSQTYDDSASLLSALMDGNIATAVIPAMPLIRARCDSPKAGAARIATLKILYRQPVYIVVRNGAAPVRRPAEWVGKTVATGPAGSDSEALTLALLDAYKVPRAKVKLQRLPSAGAVAAMRSGTAVAAVLLGHVNDLAVSGLIGSGFTLMSLPDGPERTRLLHALPALEAGAISPGAFPGISALSIVTQPVAWVAGPGLDLGLAKKLVEAVSEPHNQARIAAEVDSAPPVPDGEAFTRLPAPLAPGIEAFAQSKKLPINLIECPAGAPR